MKKITTILLILICYISFAAKVSAKLIDANGEAYAVQLKVAVNRLTNDIDCMPIQKKIVFYNDSNKKFRLKAHQVKSLQFSYRGEDYIFLSVNDNLTHSFYGKILLRLKADGYLKRFEFYEKKSNGFKNPNNNIMIHYNGYNAYKTKNDVLQKGTNTLFRVRKIRFKKEMANFLSEYPELAEKIRNKEIRIESLSEIVDNYNKWFLEIGVNQ